MPRSLRPGLTVIARSPTLAFLHLACMTVVQQGLHVEAEEVWLPIPFNSMDEISFIASKSAQRRKYEEGPRLTGAVAFYC